MKAYLNSLNEREKWMVIIAAACVFFYCYYLLLYVPLKNKVAQTSQQLIEKTHTLEWMKHVNQNHIKQPKLRLNNSKLLSIMAEQLKENQSFHTTFQLQQTASGEIQLSFDEVPFNLLMNWLAQIHQTYPIQIKQFDAERTNKSGITRLTIILTSPQ